MIEPSNRPIRIAGASGSVSDRRHALSSFAANHDSEPIDVICCDYMSEGTMAPAAMRKSRDPEGIQQANHLLDPVGPAFERTFLEALEPALPDIEKHGIRVVVNAGGSSTHKCHEAVVQMVREKGLEISVAWIEGDDVLDVVMTDLTGLRNLHTGISIEEWKESGFEVIGAQAYLGGLGIAEALKQGAQIVVCGRVSDASPYIGAAYWWHGWNRGDLDQLANALIAGHLLECSTYITGGNYSGFQALEDTDEGGWSDLGFPIGEIAKDGSVVITKQKGTGGLVSVHTCSSQLLYEIQGPWYFNSDVTAVLNTAWFEQLGPNRVALHSIKSLPPPPTTKVGITALGGYQVENIWFLTGLDIPAKARMLEAQIRAVLSPYSDNFTLLKFQVIGTALPDADNQDAATVCFRIFAQAKREEDLGPRKFLRPITDNIMQCYPGGTYHLDVRQGLPKAYYEYYVTLLPQSKLQHAVHLNGKSTLIAPPSESKTFSERPPSQPSTDKPTELSSFGPTKRLPLGTVAYARSGDKGSDCNCGLWVRSEEEYTWLRNLLSIETVQRLLGREYSHPRAPRPRPEIERFELPNLKAVHFLFRNFLDRGVTSTSEIDVLGKNVAEFLRQRCVDIPVKFLDSGPL